MAFENKMFSREGIFFKNYDFNKRSKIEIKNNDEKNYCRFSDTVPHEIDFTIDSLQKDRPPAWELTRGARF